jgi:hypothetical protein
VTLPSTTVNVAVQTDVSVVVAADVVVVLLRDVELEEDDVVDEETTVLVVELVPVAELMLELDELELEEEVVDEPVLFEDMPCVVDELLDDVMLVEDVDVVPEAAASSARAYHIADSPGLSFQLPVDV